MTNERSVYIHIPFCEHICYYCDFNKVFLQGQPVDEYIEKLFLEIDLVRERDGELNCPTLYIGGGTPTSLNVSQIERLLRGVQERVTFSPNGEFTFEANPGDLTEEKIEVLKANGVNRISLGVQTLDNRLLKKIGRKHTREDVLETLNLLDKHNMKNVSIDLIYALPTQTLNDFKQTLEEAISFGLPHYSLYSLILENKTQFMNWVRRGKLHLPDEDEQADMYDLARKVMQENGIEQYEVSNFAKSGFESKHNLVYWNNEQYYGFGAGASGYLGDTRVKNFGPIQHYLVPLREGELPVYETEYLSRANQMEEEMFLGLRKKSGVSKNHFEEKFGISYEEVYGEVTRVLIEKGLLEENGEFLSLTERGLFLGNMVFEQFLLSEQ